MVAMTRIIEGLICMAFYAGICYLLLDGAGGATPTPSPPATLPWLHS